MEEDWDLQAVVRGCTGPTATVSADHVSSFPPPSLLLHEERAGEDDLFCFPDLFATQTALYELEELCKPFFPKSSQQHQQQQQQQNLALSPQRSTSSCSGASLFPTGGGGGGGALSLPQQQIRQRPLSQTPRSKRRKNQQKRVVCQVPADGLSSDMWAWRKYGQKPIKGSPYPRGYYRCSSSKGCLARKQVERSRTDPDMFVITYTAEHNHPLPTHRNSLAGSTRHKFPPSSSSANSAQQVNAPGGGGGEVEHASNQRGTSSPPSSPTVAGLSPTTPLTASMEEELHVPRRLVGEKKEEVEEEVEEEDPLLVGDMEMLGEDDVLFMNLEELREPASAAVDTPFPDGFSDHFGTLPPPWMASSAATAAGGS